MLTPSSTLFIPSIHDGSELECRLFHPPDLKIPSHQSSLASPAALNAAVLAHPYAPLGGCCDDPVLDAVGDVLLQHGFILGLVNLRGAGASQGRTSWTSRPEQKDFESFVGFMLCYLSSMISCRNFVSIEEASRIASGYSDTRKTDDGKQSPPPHQLLIGGYSYGAMIAMQLPTAEEIVENFAHASSESHRGAIRKQAQQAAETWLRQSGMHAGKSITPTSSLNRDVVSTEENNPSAQTQQRRLHSSADSGEACDFTTSIADSYLLVSPVLGPTASLLTLFHETSWLRPWTTRHKDSVSSTLRSSHEHPLKLASNPTLAVYGDADTFTSAGRYRRWCNALRSCTESRFSFVEIDGAGHFWHDANAAHRLTTAVANWLNEEFGK